MPPAASDGSFDAALFPFFQSSFKLACCGGAALVPFGMTKNFPVPCKIDERVEQMSKYLEFADDPYTVSQHEVRRVQGACATVTRIAEMCVAHDQHLFACQNDLREFITKNACLKHCKYVHCVILYT